VTPTWLMFVYLGIASFAPVLVSLRPGRWMSYYYGALLLWWVLGSVAAVRRLAREETERRLARIAPQPRDARRAEAARTHVDTIRHPLAEERLIIVARDKVDLYVRLRKDRGADETVRVITNRRGADRRLQLEVFIPDRRRGDRRRYDVAPLLLSQGWAEVTSPRS
jgi:predicted LPLAT superfamily acyltransferase